MLKYTWLIVAWCLATNVAEAGDGDLKISWKERFLEISGDTDVGPVHGGPIRIHYLEAYCRPRSTDQDWSKTVIPHQSRLVEASPNRKRLVIEDLLEDGVIVRHVLEASDDSVTFQLTATNPTKRPSDVAWAQPCMRVDRFTGADREDSRERYPPYIEKCFLVVDGKMQRLPTQPWATKARYVPGQVYVPKNVSRNDVNPRPLSDIIPSCGLTGCYSADGDQVLAIAWEPYQEIFQGVITCMHSDFRIGGLDAGETKTIRGKLYLLPASTDVLARFQRDFSESVSR